MALKDGNPATVDWFMGPDDLATQLGINISLKRGQFAQGEKIWADDVISDRICYIATLTGSIESLNPCLASDRRQAKSMPEMSRDKCRRLGLDGSGRGDDRVPANGSKSPLGRDGRRHADGHPGRTADVNKRKVYIQSFTQPSGGSGPEPPSQVLAQPVPQNSLIIKSWREIYKIIR